MLALLATACHQPCQPDLAFLSDGYWYVTLANGSQCIGRPYMEPERDTAEEAVAECRSVSLR